LASDAGAIALNAAKTPFEAIEVLELGRGVIVGSLNEMRADISELQQKHPQLGEEYINLRDHLDAPKTLTQRQVNQRYKAGQELEKQIQTIRTLPGFDRFLLAPSEDELKAAAKYGPIVIINVSDYRCDAFIIEDSRLWALQLPRLHSTDLRDRIKTSLADPTLLEWLWDTIAQPILDALGFTQAPLDGCWPRIWWVPTGLLARFPIHAAGYHSKRSSDTVLDRVVSSYSSSIKALALSRQSRPNVRTAPRSQKVVLVGMQKTPRQNDLQFAKEEVDKLESLCNSMQLQVSKPRPVQKDVLFALKDCNIFHFAGHGLTDPSDPSKSCLLLEDWAKEALTVANLFETNLRGANPFLAYLSACGTGQVRHEKLIDGGLHLISACQLAGFQHVIGTLWEVNDKSCVDMATITYKWIQDKRMSDESVSEGLHHASRSLRGQWISENVQRGAFKRGVGVQNTKDGQMAIERSSSSQGKARDPRDIELCDDEKLSPLFWVPYVHFGV
jgi:CHAT domain-containing protein